jgi:glycosyltransferase involved in cell wall biosynthesis
VGLSQNLDLLIEAASRLRSREQLIVAIVGDGARRGALETMVKQRSLTNVRFFPYQPKELLHESFATADAFVVSLKPGLEGYIVPSKLYGILAAGRPFVAAVDPSCEVASIAIEHSCGVVAPPGSPDALVAAIAQLCDDPAAAKRMGENARRASWLFDRRAAVAAYHDLFATLTRPATASTAA